MKKKVFCFFCTTALVTLLFSSVVWAGGQIEYTNVDYTDSVVQGEDFIMIIDNVILNHDYDDIHLTNYRYTIQYKIYYDTNRKEYKGEYLKYGPFAYENFPITLKINTTDMKPGAYHITYDMEGFHTSDDYIWTDGGDQAFFKVVERPAAPEQNPNTGATTVWFSAVGLLFACSALGIFHIRKLEVQ